MVHSVGRGVRGFRLFALLSRACVPFPAVSNVSRRVTVWQSPACPDTCRKRGKRGAAARDDHTKRILKRRDGQEQSGSRAGVSATLFCVLKVDPYDDDDPHLSSERSACSIPEIATFGKLAGCRLTGSSGVRDCKASLIPPPPESSSVGSGGGRIAAKERKRGQCKTKRTLRQERCARCARKSVSEFGLIKTPYSSQAKCNNKANSFFTAVLCPACPAPR